MSIKTFITLALVTASTAAIAEPTRYQGTYERGRYDDRYDRYDRYDDRDRGRRNGFDEFSPPRIDRTANLSKYVGPVGRIESRGGFTPVTAPTRIDTLRESFDLTAAGRIGTIRLEAVRGTTRITQIGVVYGNGETEFIPVNQNIGRRNATTSDIDLRGRGRVVTILNVYGTSGQGSAYRILAAR